DKTTGYVYDIFPHMYDFQNAVYMWREFLKGKRTTDFDKIQGPWRYRNGVIVRKLNDSGNFDFVSRFTLCEREAGVIAKDVMYHGVECGDPSRFSYSEFFYQAFDKAFYGVGGYIKSTPSGSIHAYNGLLLLRDFTKSSIIIRTNTRFGSREFPDIKGSPAVVGLMVGNNLKIIPDSSNEFLKFSDSLPKIVRDWDRSGTYGKRFYDAHLQQVDDKTFAIFQIHPTSIDVVKLTLRDPRPIPQEDTRYATSSSPNASSSPQTDPSYRTFYNTLDTLKRSLDFLRRFLYDEW
ncbi:MAG: hypothetical protein ACK4NX_01730, partial [Candidatus Paceibacteria bacterium]